MVTYYLDQHEPDCSGLVIMIRDQITHGTAEPLFYGHSDTRPPPEVPFYLFLWSGTTPFNGLKSTCD